MKVTRISLTILVCVAFVVYFVLNIHKFKPLLHINPYLLLLVIVADMATIVANGVFTKFIMEPFQKYISLSESAYVSMIASVGNFFAPAGSGLGFRAVYLKKKHGFSYSDYMATLYGNYILVFLANSFFALVALFLLRHKNPGPLVVLTILFVGVFCVSLMLTLVRFPIARRKTMFSNKYVRSVFRILVEMTTGWNRIAGNKKLLLRLTGLVALNLLFSIAIAKLEITALHFSISLPALLLFSVLGSLSLFVNITPANLGVKEVIYIYSSSVIGFSTSQILSIALVDRATLFFVLFAFSALLQGYKLKNKDYKPPMGYTR